MTFLDWVPFVAFLVLLPLLGWRLGIYMARVFNGEEVLTSRVFRPLERWIYRLCGIDEGREMTWKTYVVALLLFNGIGLAVLFMLQLLQGVLPLNPAGFGPVRWDTAINTAVSFVTNTNWQSYSGETTMSYFTQMAGLAVQNFLSAAVGIASAIALIRGFARKNTPYIGNFWVDVVRTVVYILLPLAAIFAVVLVSQGAVQTLGPPVIVQTLEAGTQTISVGPAASQIAIKHLGTNGGGFFNANSAHPFENPNGVTNIIEIFLLLLIPVSLPFVFGAMIGNRRQGYAIFAAMFLLFLAGLSMAIWAESAGNPLLQHAGVAGGVNMEGKEVRFGVVPSTFMADATTATATGAVNNAHDSLLPLTGLVLLFNMLVGEVIFGGVGVGLIGIMFYVILTMFIASLMVGRTPEFLGKKLAPFDMTMAVIGVLTPGVVLLICAGIAIVLPDALASLTNSGPHGLSEILYAFASAAGNNGSAFAGLNANTVFFNLVLSGVILIGRFATIIPGIVLAGSLAAKRTVPESPAAFPTASPMFVVMLIGVVIIVGALTFFPVLMLGPFLEHLIMIGSGGP